MGTAVTTPPCFVLIRGEWKEKKCIFGDECLPDGGRMILRQRMNHRKSPDTPKQEQLHSKGCSLLENLTIQFTTATQNGKNWDDQRERCIQKRNGWGETLNKEVGARRWEQGGEQARTNLGVREEKKYGRIDEWKKHDREQEPCSNPTCHI
jgi:hypothetical protein